MAHGVQEVRLSHGKTKRALQ